MDLSSAFWDDEYAPGRENYLLTGSGRFARDIRDIFNETPVRDGQTFFEIGCGDSIFAEYFSVRKGCIPSGLDFSQRGVDLARKRMPKFGGNFVQADFRSFEVTAQYDCVSSFGFIEHFEDRRRIWDLKVKLMKKDGCGLVFAPNLCALNLFLAKHMTNNLSWHCPISLPVAISEAEEAGLTVTKSGYFGGYRMFATPENALGRYGKTIVNASLAILERIYPKRPDLFAPFFYLRIRRT